MDKIDYSRHRMAHICPKCRGQDIAFAQDNGGWYYYYCTACHKAGPHKPTCEEAWKAIAMERITAFGQAVIK